MRIILAEDSILLREGLVMVLNRLGHEVIAQVGDAPGLIEAVHAAQEGEGVDVVVTDVRMPPTNTSEGLQAAQQLRARHA